MAYATHGSPYPPTGAKYTPYGCVHAARHRMGRATRVVNELFRIDRWPNVWPLAEPPRDSILVNSGTPVRQSRVRRYRDARSSLA